MITFTSLVTYSTDGYTSRSLACEHGHQSQDAAARCAASVVRRLTRYGRQGNGMPVMLSLSMGTRRHG
jgi:hypothetical protein